MNQCDVLVLEPYGLFENIKDLEVFNSYLENRTCIVTKESIRSNDFYEALGIMRYYQAKVIFINKLAICEKEAASLVLHAPQVKGIMVLAAGYNVISPDAQEILKNNGVKLYTARGYPRLSVPQITLTAILNHATGFMKAVDDFNSKGWGDIWSRLTPAHDLSTVPIGIIGAGGDIGKKVISLLQALGCRNIQGLGLPGDFAYKSGEKIPGMSWEEDIEQFFKNSQIISCHCAAVPATPSDPGTIDLVTPELINKMADGGLLINAARGELIQGGLASFESFLERDGNVWLDTLEVEPPDKNLNQLIANFKTKFKNQLMITPHMAWGAQPAALEAIRLYAVAAACDALDIKPGKALPKHIEAQRIF